MKSTVLAALLSLCCLASFAADYRFDMGSEDSPVAPGYAQVTPATLLSANPDFGWTRSPMTTIFRSTPDNPFFGTQDTAPEFALYADGVLSIEENSFVMRVEAGRYLVTAVIGDLALGEGRPGNSIWANGVQVATNEATNASVKIVTFPVDATEGRISLRFRADSLQKYVTVQAVTAESIPQDRGGTPTVLHLPETRPTVATYRAHWAEYEARIVDDWERAKAELEAEGIDFAWWSARLQELRQRPDYREYWGWALGGGTWERMGRLTGALPLQRLCAAFHEMGIDGFICNSAAIVKELDAAGLAHAVAGSAERFPRQEMEGVTLNLTVNQDGSTETIPGVWSNCAPQAIEAFRETWRERLAEAAPGARMFVIDEPRGMWGSGRFGDYSPPAQEAFKRWAAEHGWEELAEAGIPQRGRTMDFYRFYQFRLQSVALLVEAFTRDTPVADVTAMPGNGNIGPEQMNHNSYWPPAMAQRGMISASWAYDSPASCKMYAETVRIAHEHGGESVIVPPMYAEAHTPLQDTPMNTACISAMTTRVLPWHFRGPTSAPNRSEWMKVVVLGSRLTHATTGLVHTPPLYVWCPESIVYNDLVEFNRAEADHWRATWQALFDANLDYAVTNALAVPEGATVLYSCVRPVLNEEESARLRQFVARGGTLLCTFDAAPETPDGSPFAQWDGLPAEKIVPVGLDPASLDGFVRDRGLSRNRRTETPHLKTYLYERDGRRVHLLNNTHLAAAAQFTLPVDVSDELSGDEFAEGSVLTIPPGRYALLAE